MSWDRKPSRPTVVPPPPAGYAVAYEALLPPQDVSGKEFIQVRLSDGTELGYIAESGSMLEGGHEYIYNVTVDAAQQVPAKKYIL